MVLNRPQNCARWLSALALALLTPAWPYQPAAAQPPVRRNVLAIHWGTEDFIANTALDDAIRKVLLASADPPINYYAEYLESETFPAERASAALRDYIRAKYDRPIDVVIANTSPALRFALDHRAELFPGVPIVFLAGSIPEAIVQRTAAGVTGLMSDVSFFETVELALQLHPSVKRVFVVAQAPGSEHYDERVRAALRPLSQRVELNYLNASSLPGLLSAVRSVPPESLVLYTRASPQDRGHLVYTNEVARLLAEAAPVPVYSGVDLYMGTGVVGGMMRGSHATGTRIGEMVRQILAGVPPESIPIERVQLVPTFDWGQVQRWGIDPSKLPPGSDIRFRVPTAWETYRSYIVGTIVIVTGQLLLIMGLLTQRARRRRAEATIGAREASLRTSYERIRHLTGHLINAQEAARAAIAQDLHDDICQRLVYVTLAVSGLKGASGSIEAAETQQVLSELERDTQGVFDGIRRLSHDLHPATLRVLGLAPALKAHCAEVEKRQNVRVRFTADGALGHVHPDVAVCFFRIVQESIRNGIVHGEAGRFTVSLVRSGENIELTVADDGCGFDLEDLQQNGGGIGLVTMEERARVVGADAWIDSKPGHGTTIRVRGPAEPPQGIRLSHPALPA